MRTHKELIQMARIGFVATRLPALSTFLLPAHKHELAVQLYTLREAIAKDFKGCLQRLAGIGFKKVETAFWPKDISDERAADTLKELDLSVTSCHVDDKQ